MYPEPGPSEFKSDSVKTGDFERADDRATGTSPNMKHGRYVTDDTTHPVPVAQELNAGQLLGPSISTLAQALVPQPAEDGCGNCQTEQGILYGNARQPWKHRISFERSERAWPEQQEDTCHQDKNQRGRIKPLIRSFWWTLCFVKTRRCGGGTEVCLSQTTLIPEIAERKLPPRRVCMAC